MPMQREEAMSAVCVRTYAIACTQMPPSRIERIVVVGVRVTNFTEFIEHT
jgi:hypothetical protein